LAGVYSKADGAKTNGRESVMFYFRKNPISDFQLLFSTQRINFNFISVSVHIFTLASSRPSNRLITDKPHNMTTEHSY